MAFTSSSTDLLDQLAREQGVTLGQAPGPFGPGDQPTVWDQLMAHFVPIGIRPGAFGPNVAPMTDRYTGDWKDSLGSSPYTGDWKDSIVPMSPAEQRERDRAYEKVRQVQADRARLKALAEQAGLDPEDPIQLAEFWRSGVEQAQKASIVDGTAPQELVWSLLEGWAQDGYPGTQKAEQSELERAQSAFEPFDVTTTSKNIQLTDPKTARALVTRFLQEELGRDPSDDEIRDFTAGLTKYERDNPTVTTTVSQYGMDESGSVRVTSSDSTTTGGSDPTGFAADFVEDDEFSAESRGYQAVKYSGIIDALIGG